jgi:hypothetical protein
MQTGAAFGSSLIDSDFDIQEQLFHLPSPVLLPLFVQKGQLTQMMHVTECMRASILPIRTPTIMHTHSLKVCQDANGVQRLFTAFDMHG